MNQERIDRLLSCRKEEGYDDISYDKQLILEDIYKDPDIFEVLHNTELEKAGAVPEDYYNVNIYSYLKIPDSQSKVKNFICFEVNHLDVSYQNKIMITKQVIIRTVSHKDDVETIYGIDRQDLLGALIKERLQWSNLLGTQLVKTYDAGKVAENGYYYRNIYFTQITPNGLQNRVMSNHLDGRRDYYGQTADLLR